MHEGGLQQHPRWARLLAGAVIVAAIVMLAAIVIRAGADPSTDAATIDADIVHVAAEVGGRIVRLGVAENSRVRAGDLLFAVDPEPYRDAVDQARADLALARAALGTQRRLVATQGSTATVAVDQQRRAEANAQLAARTVERLRPLAAQGYVPMQQLDQAEVAARDAATSLAQARVQRTAAGNAVDTVEGAAAAVKARAAALAIAERALRQTEVRATHDGRVVGLTIATGELIAPSQALFTLIVADEWSAIGNFRETSLDRIRVGDCATVYSLIDRTRPMRGTVSGIGSGVLDTERVNLPRALPYVERSLNWVRVAQRFPVRVKLADPPDDLVRLGASAIIEVRRGASCR